MAEAVVEHLEAVQVDVQQGQAAAALARALAGLVQAVLEQGAVGQAGELVVVREVAQALLGIAACGEVGEKADDVAGVAPGITHHVELQPLRVELAVLAGVHQFALPAAALLQLLADQVVLAAALAGAVDLHHRVAKHLVAAVAGNVAEGLVDRQQAVLRVEDNDALAGRLEDHGREALLLLGLLALGDVAAGAEHAQHLALLVALHHPATVLDPEPAAVAVAHPVVDGIAVAAALEVLHQSTAQQRQVVGVQARLEVAEHAGDVVHLDAEDFLQVRVMDFVGLQVPVPHPQLAGLQGHGQARLALDQGVAGVGQLQGALGDADFQVVMGRAQLALGTPALLHFPRQLAVEPFGADLGVFQVVDQRLVVEALQQAALHQAVDLPGHHHQRRQEDQAEQPPAPLQRLAAGQQPGHGGHQARQGEGEEGLQADGIGDARGEDRSGDQAIDQRLLQKGVARHQEDHRQGQGQAGSGGAEEEGAAPLGLGLARGQRGLEGGHLGQAQHRQQHQPDQPATQQQAVGGLPQQVGADQAVEQHEERGGLRALIEQTRALHGQIRREMLADGAAVVAVQVDWGFVGCRGHRRFSCNGCLGVGGAYPSRTSCQSFMCPVLTARRLTFGGPSGCSARTVWLTIRSSVCPRLGRSIECRDA